MFLVFWSLIASEEILNILEEQFAELKDKVKELFQKALVGDKIMEWIKKINKSKDLKTNMSIFIKKENQYLKEEMLVIY